MALRCDQSLGEGAFRRGELRKLCAVCGEPAPLASCPRCQSPLCETHAVVGDDRCPSCVQALGAFQRDRATNPVGTGIVIVASLVGLGAAVATIIATRGGASELWIVPVALVAVWLPALVGIYRRLRVRRVFLAETPDVRRLRLPPPVVVDPPTPRDTAASKPLDALAVAGMVFAMLFFVPVLPLVGVALSVAALVGKRRHQLSGRGFAIAGLAIGIPAAVYQGVMAAFILFGHG